MEKNKTNKFEKKMDDLDDSLDDLLRDASVNKFKKSPIANDILPESTGDGPPAPSSRKDRKSALLAELFGTTDSSLTIGLEDHNSEKHSGSFKNFTSEESKKRDELGFGGYVPSGLGKQTPNLPTTKSSPQDAPVSNFGGAGPSSHLFSSSPHLEKKSEQLSSGGLSGASLPKTSWSNSDEKQSNSLKNLPSLPIEEVKKPEEPSFGAGYAPSSFSKPNRPFSSPQQDFSFSQSAINLSSSPHLDLSTQNKKSDGQVSFGRPSSSPQQHRSVFGNLPLTSNTEPAAPPRFQDHQPSAKTPEKPQQTFWSPKANPSDEQSITLSAIKTILSDFTGNFCARLEGITGSSKTEGLAEITGILTELQKCISAASQNLVTVSSQTGGSNPNAELEKKVHWLEGRIDGLVQDNASLRARLEAAELAIGRNQESVRTAKLDLEAAMDSQAKLTREAVNRLEATAAVKESAANEEIRSMQNRINQLQNQLDNLSSAASGSNQIRSAEEVLSLLKAELKWLERQKTKLKQERQEHRQLQLEIQRQLERMHTLSTEISLAARDVQAQNIVVEGKLQKMEQKWADLLEKQLELQMAEAREVSGKQQQRSPSSNSHHVEDLGLALWKLHVKGDELRLLEQTHFLQSLNNPGHPHVT